MDVFKDVKNYYPESPEALRAEVRVADCHFSMEEFEEAVAIYQEFRKLHPYHEDIPYILFQIGQAYFKQIRSSDRDPTPARNALSNFQYLVQNYPPSIFTDAAEGKIPICLQNLAEHEFLVGRYYYKKKMYDGAIARFERVLQDYPDTEVAPKTLFYLGNTFLVQSLEERAKAAFLELTHRYPGSGYASKARAVLNTRWSESEPESGSRPMEKSPAAPL
jgi:outer membrane protein assembly factor BamD